MHTISKVTISIGCLFSVLFCMGQANPEYVVITASITHNYHDGKITNNSYWIIRTSEIDVDKNKNNLYPFYFKYEDLTKNGLTDCLDGKPIDLFNTTTETNRNFSAEYLEKLKNLESMIYDNKILIQKINKEWFDGSKSEIKIFATLISGIFSLCKAQSTMSVRFSTGKDLVLPVSDFESANSKKLKEGKLLSFIIYTDFTQYGRQNRIW